MFEEPTARVPDDSTAGRLARIERRMARIEAHLRIEEPPAEIAPPVQPAALDAAPSPASPPSSPPASNEAADEWEFEMGRIGFAAAGIVALVVGGGIMLSLPFNGLPAGVPSALGYVAVAVLFGLAQAGRRAWSHLVPVLNGAGMVLLYWATLRLFFFGARPVLDAHALSGGAVLVAASAFNLAFAWLRRSPWLMALALVTACVTPVVVGSGRFMAGTVAVLAVAGAAACRAARRPGLLPAGIVMVYLTYFIWAIGNPFFGGAYHWATEPFAPAGLFAAVLIFGVAPLWRAPDAGDDVFANAGAVLNCGLGYGVFLLHTAAAFPKEFVVAHTLAAVLLLGVAVAFWVRWRSRVSTFFYAMTGYAALTMAIAKATVVPDVFVWLSLQSLVVMATAIWFRSRFIIVANFLIFVAIVGSYMLMNERESGISVGFGVVALVSARILNWKQHRLELKTGLMRNAYLTGAFLVFPYALYHLVPGRGVPLAWVALAVAYYALGLVVRNQKYRWMGHGTLLLTAVHLVVVGSSRFEPVYRILSFLALGTVLLCVSLVFTRLRKRS